MRTFKPLEWSVTDLNQYQMEWFAPAAGGGATVEYVNGKYTWNLGDECRSIDGGVETSHLGAMQKAQAAHEVEFTRLMEMFLEGGGK